MNFEQYSHFITQLTSDPSMRVDDFIESIVELHGDTNIPRLITGAMGLGSESGELQEIVKKILFQGKPLDKDTKFHMKRELGDIFFYWITTCLALGYTPESVIAENVDKLSARYPQGFSVHHSENRAEGDL